MELLKDKEKELLTQTYPENSKERNILEYSTSNKIVEEVPKFFIYGFYALVAATVFAIVYLLVVSLT